MRSLTIQIPQPCHERWDAMQPSERGRFCASCQKPVVDYTTFSDQELVRLLSKSSETGCGHFRDEQLNRLVVAPQSSVTSVWHRWLGFLTMGLLSWQSVQAQNEELPPRINQERVVIPTPATLLPTIRETIPEWVFRGKVSRVDSNGAVWPIKNAMVSVLRVGSNTGQATPSDSNGEFILTYQAADPNPDVEIRVFATGYRSRRFILHLTPSNQLMKLDDVIFILSDKVKPTVISGGMTHLTENLSTGSN